MGYKDSTDARFLFKGQIVTDDAIDDSAAIANTQLAATDSTYIFVATNGSDTGTGSVIRPYATVTKAFSVVTTARKTIFVMPGDYAEAAMLTWPNVHSLSVIGMGGHGTVNITNGGSGAAVLKIDPTFTASNMEAFIENIGIESEGTHGLWIDNAAITRKLIVHLKNVAFSGDSDNSIHLDHTTAGQTMKLYVNDCKEIEGVVNITPANDSDVFKFDNCELVGGLTFADVAKTAQLTLRNSLRLTGDTGTGNAATVVAIMGCQHRTNENLFSDYTDVFST